MSFPPHLNRPLLPPPGIPPQYTGFPPGAPMIPVHMGIMAPTPAVMVPSVPVLSKPAVPKRETIAVNAKDSDENSGPTTTVFVGNISEKASDMLIRQLLAVRGEHTFYLQKHSWMSGRPRRRLQMGYEFCFGQQFTPRACTFS
uniref:Uncharacterized protein n=1 Tax=Oreochromis niloticus TaxID=8128 RepID=A0A669BRL1_ORENI